MKNTHSGDDLDEFQNSETAHKWFSIQPLNISKVFVSVQQHKARDQTLRAPMILRQNEVYTQAFAMIKCMYVVPKMFSFSFHTDLISEWIKAVLWQRTLFGDNQTDWCIIDKTHFNNKKQFIIG